MSEARGRLATQRGHARRQRTAASLVAQFAISGLAALVIVGVGATFVIRHQGLAESIRDAREVTSVLGYGVVEPNLSQGVVAGEPESLARFDRLVRRRVIRDDVVRVKLWTATGRIVYSDEPRLIGSVYPLGSDERTSLTTGRVDAALSDLQEPENRFERSQGKLLEVYLPVDARNGQRLLFEAYLRYSSVSATGRDIWFEFAPILLAALVVLWLAQTPLAWSLARRLQRGRAEQEELLLHAINASDAERRRIAADLHDGVVQDLAGIAFSLAASAEAIDRTDRTETASALRRAAASTREAVRRLRSLLVEIYPPSLQNTGLEAALADLIASLDGRGFTATLEVDPVELDPTVEHLVFRTTQEALRNVSEHADAHVVDVSLKRRNGRAVLQVRDDGRGFSDATLGLRRAQGHVGLALLADRARQLGGTLAIESAPEHGTLIRLEVDAG